MPERFYEKRHFIEDISLYFEQMGMPRTAGRILGVLLICDPPEASMIDLCEELQASKSSVSTNARLLDEMDLIERVATPLPRQICYRFKPGGWVTFMRMRLRLYGSLHHIAERGLDLLQDADPPLRARLQEAHDMFSAIEEELPLLLKHIQEEHGIP
ncbi:MAG: MarR family transcriptional regulator [Anaerolineae bacterium]|jgi:DNA-binding transcriptional regulator GbsR (MarR family)|nr:MarR family transcriptional regulator [Anaerolineae bacterium]